MINQYFTRRFQFGGTTLSKQQLVESQAETSVSQTISASGSANIDCSIIVGQLQSVFISTSVDDTTFTFNDGGETPVVLSIKANVPYCWTEDCLLVNLLTDNFTDITVANPSSEDAAVVNINFQFYTDD